MSNVPKKAKVHYRESDGKPMGETPWHRDVMIDTIHGLEDWFLHVPRVYVSGNMFLYYVEGKPRHHVSPDVMVVLNVDRNSDRRTYKTWEEGGKAPDLVIEVTSSATRQEDASEKYRLYRDKLKVREYLLFDPCGDWMRPTLRGYRLVEGDYVPIEEAEGRLPSEVAGLHFESSHCELQMIDPTKDRRLLKRWERLADGTMRRQRERFYRINEEIRLNAEAIRRAEELNERLRRILDERTALFEEMAALLEQS